MPANRSAADRSPASKRRGRPLVGKAEELCVAGAEPEEGERGERLGAAPGPEGTPRRGADEQPPFGGALGPRVPLAVGEEHHADRGAGRDRSLDQASGREGLVIRVRRDDQQPVGGGELERLGHGAVILRHVVGKRKPTANGSVAYLTYAAGEGFWRSIRGQEAPMARGRVTRWAVRVVVGLVVVVAVAVLAGYVAARRSVWRPGAGTVRLSGLQRPVEIAVDRFGVPHVSAQTVEDALFAQGYLHARERFFQMELTRRAAAGRLAELLGAAAVGFDTDLRRWNLGPNVARQTAALDGEARAAVEAYARGVNAAIDRFGAAGLAPEFLLLGSAVDPWRVEDTVGVGLMMEMNLTWAADEERGRADLLRALGRERAVELWGWTAEQATAWIPDDLPGSWLLRSASRPIAPLEGVGSNNWALAPSRTRTGRAIFANDPHIGVANPSTWYEVHLTAPDFAVAGASVPGAPGVLIGHNAEVAWGFTMVMLDDQDVFRLKLDAAGEKELIAGEWQPLEVRREQVAVRGEREPREVTVKVSAHGPVIEESADGALAMSWAALLGRSPLPAFLRLDRARSVEEAATAFADADAPGVNLLCADRAGHVRWQVVGRVPIRGRGAGRLPAPGWDPAWAWQGLAPYERNPTAVDPPEGFVATANHDAFTEADFPREAEYPAEFAAPWRIRRIREELGRRTDWDVADCLKLQMDDRNGQAMAIRRGAAADARGDRHAGGAGAARLGRPDGRGEPRGDAVGRVPPRGVAADRPRRGDARGAPPHADRRRGGAAPGRRWARPALVGRRHDAGRGDGKGDRHGLAGSRRPPGRRRGVGRAPPRAVRPSARRRPAARSRAQSGAGGRAGVQRHAERELVRRAGGELRRNRHPVAAVRRRRRRVGPLDLHPAARPVRPLPLAPRRRPARRLADGTRPPDAVEPGRRAAGRGGDVLAGARAGRHEVVVVASPPPEV